MSIKIRIENVNEEGAHISVCEVFFRKELYI